MSKERSAVENAPLSQQVYDTLLNKLLNNELVSGQILNRRQVAADLGVSVAPVLEAMLKLETHGFLESIPRKGTQVRPITPEDVHGLLVLREALECHAARLYCGEAIETNEAALLILADKLDNSPPFVPEHWREDLNFHYALIEITGVGALIKEYHRAMHLNIFHAVNRLIETHDQTDDSNHRELVIKLETRDPDEAERIIRAHVRSGKGSLFDGRA